MKRLVWISIGSMLVVGSLIYAYRQAARERAADEQADKPIAAASSIQNAQGETRISLTAEAQALIGIRTATLMASESPVERIAYGRVLDLAPLLSLRNEAVATRASLQASRREYGRLKELSGQENASPRALEAAWAQLQRDQGAYDTAEAQLSAATCRAVAEQAAGFFESLARRKSVLVRLDLPVEEGPTEDPTGARLSVPGAGETIDAAFLGRAATVDPQVQGLGFLFLVDSATPGLVPGLAVSGFVEMPGESLQGVIVPEAAVLRSGDRAWVYLQTGSDQFVRREISLDRPVAGGWFLTKGVASGDKVVVQGAQMLLSEERKHEIRMED